MSAAFHKPGDGWYGWAHGRVVGPFESAEKANEIANAIPSYMVRPGIFQSWDELIHAVAKVAYRFLLVLGMMALLYAVLLLCGLIPDSEGNFPLNNDHPTNWLDNQK